MKTKIIDLKRSKKEMKKMDTAPVAMEHEKYPWGTRLNLNEEELEKLGVSVENFKVGSKIMIAGSGKIVEVSKSDREGGKPSQRLEIQVTHVGLATGKKSKKLDWDTPPDKAGKILKEKGFY